MMKMDLKGIQYQNFFEPDDNMGLTAVCTECLQGSIRNIFRGFKLWEYSV